MEVRAGQNGSRAELQAEHSDDCAPRFAQIQIAAERPPKSLASGSTNQQARHPLRRVAQWLLVWDAGRLKRVDRAARVTRAEPYAITLRAGKVGDRDDVLRIAREFDELGRDAAPGDIERQVDATGSERADPLRHAVAVADGLGME